ncbi:MAG TPA: ABC transporter substrate-binding protein, partial [Clostridia bacterium]|nr:ABC transporter substrate-binding protein [Clostridia bacterium]
LNYTFNYQLPGRDDLPYLLVKFPYALPQLEFSEQMPLIPVYNSLVTIPETVTYTDIARYSEEEVTKFIYGQRSLDEWDQFVDTLFKTYNLQDYLDQAESDLREAGLID